MFRHPRRAGALAGLLAQLSSPLPVWAAAELAAPLERAALIQQVLERNPSSAAAREAWRAATAVAPQVSALDDPMLSYSIAPLSLTGRARFGQVVELAQAFPFPGKRALRSEVAQAEADAARHDWESVRQRLALMASLLFDDDFVVHRALAINAEHLELLRVLKRSAEAQYAAGRATQADPLQAEVETSTLLREKLALEAQREVVAAQLRGLLHLPPDAALPAPPVELTAGAGDAVPPLEALVAEALQHRPELAGAKTRVSGREAAVRLQRRESWPDLRVMGSYNTMWMETPHQFMAGVAVNVPLQLGRRSAAVTEAEARLRGARHQAEGLVDDIQTEVSQARSRLLEAREAVKLFRTRQLPAARDQVVAARAGFESGRNTFQVLIDAERALRGTQLRLEEASADVHRRDAELKRAVGRLAPVRPRGAQR